MREGEKKDMEGGAGGGEAGDSCAVLRNWETAVVYTFHFSLLGSLNLFLTGRTEQEMEIQISNSCLRLRKQNPD